MLSRPTVVKTSWSLLITGISCSMSPPRSCQNELPSFSLHKQPYTNKSSGAPGSKTSLTSWSGEHSLVVFLLFLVTRIMNVIRSRELVLEVASGLLVCAVVICSRAEVCQKKLHLCILGYRHLQRVQAEERLPMPADHSQHRSMSFEILRHILAIFSRLAMTYFSVRWHQTPQLWSIQIDSRSLALVAGWLWSVDTVTELEVPCLAILFSSWWSSNWAKRWTVYHSCLTHHVINWRGWSAERSVRIFSHNATS